MYGRATREDDGTTVVQYWFFYYYDGDRPFGVGNHEGDWEMVQYMIAADGVPDAAAYTQHNQGEQCQWIRVQRTDDGHPIVYVGLGSHANFFSSGHHIIEAGAYDDRANGDGEWVIPSVTDVTSLGDGTGPFQWLWWRGRWGSTGGDFPSPTSPTFHGQQWDDPFGWGYSEGSNACTESQTYSPYQGYRPAIHGANGRPRGGAADHSPRLPHLTVRRRGRYAVIKYAFAVGTRPNRLELLTSTDSTGDRMPPLTRASRVTTRTGTITRRLPPGPGPFRVLVSVRTRIGASSKTKVIPLR